MTKSNKKDNVCPGCNATVGWVNEKDYCKYCTKNKLSLKNLSLNEIGKEMLAKGFIEGWKARGAKDAEIVFQSLRYYEPLGDVAPGWTECRFTPEKMKDEILKLDPPSEGG